MNTETVSVWAQMIASVSVIISLFYLAVQGSDRGHSVNLAKSQTGTQRRNCKRFRVSLLSGRMKDSRTMQSNRIREKLMRHVVNCKLHCEANFSPLARLPSPLSQCGYCTGIQFAKARRLHQVYTYD